MRTIKYIKGASFEAEHRVIMSAKRFAIWFDTDSLPVWMLGVVALVELMMCIDYHEQRWDRVVVPHGLPPQHAGEGLVIQWNGLGYYAWLRSLMIDHDWDFDNEFDQHNPHSYYVPPPHYRTALGRRANPWSVGPACIWAGTLVPGHWVLKAVGGQGPWAADGYSLPYQVLVGGSSLLAAFLGLALLYGICRTQARPARAALAVALLTLGTTIVYYSAIEISLPHGLGTAVLAAAVWYWLTSYGSLQPRRWFLVGVLIGAAALVRWQLATFALLPAAEWVLGWFRRLTPHPQPLSRRGRGEENTLARLALLAAVGVVLAFLPQLIAWRCVYGSWLVAPIQGVRYHWGSPSFWAILCSEDRSLFYWTPLTLLACIGAVACLKPAKAPVETNADLPFDAGKEPLWILLAAFAVQVYALAGMWGKGEMLENTANFGGVFLARSYGFRDLTESLVVLAPGLAWLLEHAGRWTLRMLAGLGLTLVTWNLLLVSLYSSDLIPSQAGASLSTLFSRAAALMRQEPFVLLQILQGPILIGLLLGFAAEKAPGAQTT